MLAALASASAAQARVPLYDRPAEHWFELSMAAQLHDKPARDDRALYYEGLSVLRGPYSFVQPQRIARPQSCRLDRFDNCIPNASLRAPKNRSSGR